MRRFSRSLVRAIDCVARRPRTSIAFACLFVGAAVAGAAEAQQTPDQAFFNGIRTACSQSREAGSRIDDFCWIVFPGGTSGPGALQPGGVGINASAGSMGNLATSSGQQRRCRGSEKECREERNRRGGGSSADLRFDRFGVLIAGQSGRGDRDRTALEQGYDSELEGLVVGVDYRFTDRLLAGLTLASTDNDADFSGGSGTLDSRTRNGTLYATYLPLDNAYVGAYFGYSRVRQEGTRRAALAPFPVTETARYEGRGRQLLMGVSGGYDWNLGAATVGAFLNVDRIRTRLDSYSETGATYLSLDYPEQSIVSLTSTLGVRGAYRAAFEWGAITPEIRIAHIHEFKNDARTIDTRLRINPATVISLNTDAPDRNYYLAGAGVAFEFGSRVRLFVDYERRSGHAYLSNSAFNVGLHVGF